MKRNSNPMPGGYVKKKKKKKRRPKAWTLKMDQRTNGMIEADLDRFFARND